MTQDTRRALPPVSAVANSCLNLSSFRSLDAVQVGILLLEIFRDDKRRLPIFAQTQAHGNHFTGGLRFQPGFVLVRQPDFHGDVAIASAQTLEQRQRRPKDTPRSDSRSPFRTRYLRDAVLDLGAGSSSDR